jgi:hypothetical protein
MRGILIDSHSPPSLIAFSGPSHDLNAIYWWYDMKRDVAEYVALCDTCQRVKAEHQ